MNVIKAIAVDVDGGHGAVREFIDAVLRRNSGGKP